MSDSTASRIVKPETLAQINDGLAKLDFAQQELDLALRAGVSELPGGETLKDEQIKINKYREHLLQMKRVYFPNA